MSRSRRPRTPGYCLHRPSGQARVTLNGKDYYLGKYGSPESREAYDRLIAEWLAAGRQTPAPAPAENETTVSEVILAYLEFASAYYRKPTGEATKEQGNLRLVLRRLRQLYGHSAASRFDSLALEALRDQMVSEGLCRTRINKDVERVKRVFKWAASKRLVPAAVPQLLATVVGLRAGRTEARERPPVQPVPDSDVDATLAFLRPQVAAMVRLQRLTGMRPGEVAVMRTMDVDTTGQVWIYRPGSDQGPQGAHKTAWRGHSRVIALGPRAQELLKSWLRGKVTEYLFQPREARSTFDAERRAKRKSKVPPSQASRRPKRNPKKKLGERYSDSSYANAVAKACRKAGVPCWSPNRLRHSHATEVRKRFGLEAAQVALGHSRANVTEVYAERDHGLAVEVAIAIG